MHVGSAGGAFVTSPRERKVVLALGHSHLHVLAGTYKIFEKEFTFDFSPLQLRQPDFQPNIRSGPQKEVNERIVQRFSDMVATERPDLIISCIMGNEYNALAMLKPTLPYDFEVPTAPALPLDPTAEKRPFAPVKADLRRRLNQTLGVYLGSLAPLAPVRFIHVPPPPPVQDNAFIERYPGSFGDKVKEAGLSAPYFRLKMWLATCLVQEELCRQAGVTYHPLPHSVFCPAGFLNPAMLGNSPTHGNAHFGKEILLDVAKHYLAKDTAPLKPTIETAAAPLISSEDTDSSSEVKSMMMKQQIKRVTFGVAAKRISEAAGMDWRAMSSEERAMATRNVQGKETPEDRAAAVVLVARREAKEANRNWRKMTEDERNDMITRVQAEG